MDNSKAKLICLLFKLKPAIKNSVDKHKYQKTINSFEEHYSDIDARVNQEKGMRISIIIVRKPQRYDC